MDQTLVDGPRPGVANRHPVSHRAGGGAPRFRSPVAPVSPAGAPGRPRPASQGKVYRPTYLPPSLHVLLVLLYALTLVAGIALGVELHHLIG